MCDLIDRQALLEAIDLNRKCLIGLDMLGAEDILVHWGRRLIEEAPSVNREKTGYWQLHSNDDDNDRSYWCSECHYSVPEDMFYPDGYVEGVGWVAEPFEFCPMCGSGLYASKHQKYVIEKEQVSGVNSEYCAKKEDGEHESD